MTTQAIEEALNFLLGTKTTESLSAELSRLLYVPRPVGDQGTLEEALASALQSGRNVVVTGSAGGGKTALLRHIAELIGSEPNLTVVEDLTAVEEPKRAPLIQRSMAVGNLLLAVNEGVLMQSSVREALPGVWESLRDMQEGTSSPIASESVVVDLAGLNPIEAAMSRLLSSEILHEAVTLHESRTCASFQDFGTCPRVEALTMLKETDTSPGMATFVGQLAKLGLGSGEVLFREVWDFIADIFVGGACETPLPTSTWFWRMFFGTSRIAVTLEQSLQPRYLTLPREMPFIWRGDWGALSEAVGGIAASLVDPGVIPSRVTDPSVRNDLITWFKIQLALTKRVANLPLPRFPGEEAVSTERKVIQDGRIDVLISNLNAYFRREKAGAGASDDLRLWVDFSIERQEKRTTSLVGILNLPESQLSLRRSQVVAHLHGVNIDGSRVYAAAKGPGEASLLLDSRLFEALVHGRPVSTKFRSFDDVDFAIRRFYLQLACTIDSGSANTLRLLQTGGTHPGESAWRFQANQLPERLVP